MKGKIELIDLSGNRYGMLVAISFHHKEKRKNHVRYYWEFLCDCGNTKIINRDEVVNHETFSCGCYRHQIRITPRRKNHYEFFDSYIIGYTELNEKFIIDKEDFDLIKNFYWYVDAGYMKNRIEVNGKRRVLAMHRLIMNANKNQMIDHINQNRSDNRKSNLRFANKAQNSINSGVRTDNLSGFRGIRNAGNKWCSQITHKQKMIVIGYFDNFEDAVIARIQREIELYGEFSPYYKEFTTAWSEIT